MTSVLVTGGAGYLGSVIVRELLANDFRVTVIDNLLYGQTSLLGCCDCPHFEFVRGDVRDEALMKRLLREADVILPLAAVVGLKACQQDPRLARTVNYDAIVLLDRLRSPEQRVVFPCTNSGYGAKNGEVFCTEESALEPVSLYGETKVRAEQVIRGQPNTISLRLATVFGPSPRMRLDLLVNDFVWRAVTDGYLAIYEKDFKRNYVHIDDVAAAFLYCLEHFAAMKDQVYNVGLNDANLSKAELAEKVKRFVPKLAVHYAEVGSDPDRRNYVVSNEKINRAGFVARRGLDEGIPQLIQAYRMLPRTPFVNA